MTTMKQ